MSQNDCFRQRQNFPRNHSFQSVHGNPSSSFPFYNIFLSTHSKLTLTFRVRFKLISSPSVTDWLSQSAPKLSKNNHFLPVNGNQWRPLVTSEFSLLLCSEIIWIFWVRNTSIRSNFVTDGLSQTAPKLPKRPPFYVRPWKFGKLFCYIEIWSVKLFDLYLDVLSIAFLNIMKFCFILTFENRSKIPFIQMYHEFYWLVFIVSFISRFQGFIKTNVDQIITFYPGFHQIDKT